MADEWIRKDYDGGAVATTISGAIGGGATSISVASGTSLPDGSAGKFVVCIDRGLATEEKILITSRSGNTLTVSARGYDGTVAQSHAAGATIEHVLDAHSIDFANALAAAFATAGSMAYRGVGNSFVELPVGAENSVYGVVGGVPAPITLATLQALIIPAGTTATTIASSAPTGWLFHNQTILNANSTYPSLWAVAPASWKSGTTLTIPDLTDAALMQAGTTVLGASGGANSRTIATANLPSHTHGATGLTASTSGTVTVDDNTTDRVTRLASATPGSYIALADSDGNGVADGLSQGGMVTSYETEHGHTASMSATTTISGSTAATGSGTALTTTPKHLAVNIMIKAH